VRELIIRIALAFSGAAFLVVVVAPFFGYKVDFLLRQLSNDQSSDVIAEDPSLVDPGFTGYDDSFGGYQEPAGLYGPPTAYASPSQARKIRDNSGRGVSKLLKSIDVVDTAFNYMDIEEEVCRLKTVCEMESYAVNHPLARLAINTINSSLKGLERYQDAVDAGIEGQDCALLYDQCPYSYFGY